MVTLLLVLTPWSWYTIGFDFHFEAFTALFGLLAARSLWAGRYRGLLLWLPLTLLSCAAAGALLAIALGLVSLVSRGVARRVALAVLVVGVGWLTLAASLGAMRFGGLHLGAMYGYLSANPREQFGLPNLLGGLVANPVRAFDMFNTNVGYVAGYIASAGVIGLWSRWGLLVAAIVLLPSSINADPDFIHFAQAFQSWPAVVFLVVACVLTLQRLAGKAVHSHRVIYVFGGCSVALAATVTGLFVGHIPSYIERVSPAAARELSGLQRHIPAGAEVIASQGVIGRFGAGHVAFSYWGTGLPETYAVVASPVIFILAPVQGTAEGIPEATRQAITYVGTRLRARLVALKGTHYNLLGDHFEPMVALLVPTYWIWPNPAVLLVDQGILVALSVIPVWMFAERRFGLSPGIPRLTTTSLVATYALAWQLQSLVGSDFHSLAFAVPILAVSIERADAGRWRAATIWALSLLLVKEDLSLIVVAFGVYAFVLGRRRLRIFLVAVGAAAFGLLVDVIVPAFAGGAYPHWSYKELGSGPCLALRYVITHPIATLKLMISPRPKLVLLGAVFLPGALLSLLSPIVILAVPALLERVFSQRSDVWSTGFQYSAPLAPILGMAVIDGLWRAAAGTSYVKCD